MKHPKLWDGISIVLVLFGLGLYGGNGFLIYHLVNLYDFEYTISCIYAKVIINMRILWHLIFLYSIHV